MKRTIPIPLSYKPQLSMRETESAIKLLKDSFEALLADNLYLTRVTAPMFVPRSSGLNDNLNGIERPVSFEAKDLSGEELEVVQSLAKWKRLALYRYGFVEGEGLYTDMNAIRRDEVLSSIHSLYVDQWDWEKVIPRKGRSLDTLVSTALLIYAALRATEALIYRHYPQFTPFLPQDMTVISSQELEDLFPDLAPEERERCVAKKHGAVLITQIGKTLRLGKVHDGRAPDYDDWELNGDIIFWHPILEIALEISSMGVRVDDISLRKQLAWCRCEDRSSFPFHRMILENKLPFTIGGGIGQSRLCMFFLRKAHIGEVQSGVWPEWMHKICDQTGIPLL